MLPLSSTLSGLFGGGGRRRPVIAGALAIATVSVAVSALRLSLRAAKKQRYISSPAKTVLPGLTRREAEQLPYPPDALPEGRDVETPYGSIRVYEWGPEDGDRVLFLHGISTPIIALGNLGHEMVDRGCRVMLFDLFGRGYSDAPSDLPYDERLFTTQMLMVLSSSNMCWTASPGFHIVGYSLGGGLSVSFARYFPHLVRSLTLVATCGLIRSYHVGWRSWLYYNSGLLPELLVSKLVRERIRPEPAPLREASGGDIVAAESEGEVNGDGDCNGGKGFDSTAISKHRLDATVASVVRWQVDNHQGFIMAFLSTIRNSPIYPPQEDWNILSATLKERRGREDHVGTIPGLYGGKILMILGEDDPVIVKKETMADAEALLGHDGVEFSVLAGSHELPISDPAEVAEAIIQFWTQQSN